MRPCGCPLDVGRKFFPQINAKPNVCTCCGSFEECVALPAGAGRIYNCVHCLNPHAKRGACLNDVLPKARTFKRSRISRIPRTLWDLIRRDPEQIRNDAPSAQRQKAGQDHSRWEDQVWE